MDGRSTHMGVNMKPWRENWKLCILLTLILSFSVPSIICEELGSHVENFTLKHYPSHTRQSKANLVSSQIKLKACMDLKLTDDTDTVYIPTFYPGSLTYEAVQYKVDKKQPLKNCSGGAHPRSVVNIMSEDEYWKKVLTGDNYNQTLLFELLRTVPFLFPNGYLSADNENVTAAYHTPQEFCVASIQGRRRKTVVGFRTCPFSHTRPVLPKCCPLGMMVKNQSCSGFSSDDKWDPGYFDTKTFHRVSIDQANPVYTLARKPCNENMKQEWRADNCTKEFHPTTSNTVVYIGEFRTWKTLSLSESWCIDSKMSNTESWPQLTMFFCRSNNETKDKQIDKLPPRISRLYMIAMYIGAVFHFLTTAAHIAIWSKLTIYGKTLCSCTASLFFMNIFWGTFHLLALLEKQEHTALCIGNSIFAQYFTIAAFTWLLMVNFDLWRTYRTVSIEKDGKFRRFLVYSILGWGFPLLVSIISITINFSYRCQVTQVLTPDYGEHYCFIAPWAQGPYLYYVLAGLMGCSFIFAALTILSLCRVSTKASQLYDDQKSDRYKMLFFFLKLSVIMGLSWVLEVIGWIIRANENYDVTTSQVIVWTVVDLYNSLSAILIFIVFVCNSATFEMLEEAIPRLKGVRAAFKRD